MESREDERGGADRDGRHPAASQNLKRVAADREFLDSRRKYQHGIYIRCRT